MLIPEGSRAAHQQHRAKYWEHPVTRPMGKGLTLHAQRKDGSRFPVEISLSPVRSDDGIRVTAIIRDVTDRKIAEEQIRAVNQQLQQRNQEVERANRLKSEFLASMSHELRTPLHTILGFTELLEEEVDGPLNERQKRFVSHVHQDAQHLLELINDILDLSKIEAGKLELRFEVFDARQAVEEVVASLQGRADGKNLTVENRVAADCAVKADRVRFKEIFYNLLSNAVKFTLEGGRIEIDCAVARLERLLFREGHRHRHSQAGAGFHLRQVLPGRFHHQGRPRRHRPGPRHHQATGGDARRRASAWRANPAKGSTFSFTVPLDSPKTETNEPVDPDRGGRAVGAGTAGDLSGTPRFPDGRRPDDSESH